MCVFSILENTHTYTAVKNTICIENTHTHVCMCVFSTLEANTHTHTSVKNTKLRILDGCKSHVFPHREKACIRAQESKRERVYVWRAREQERECEYVF